MPICARQRDCARIWRAESQLAIYSNFGAGTLQRA